MGVKDRIIGIDTAGPAPMIDQHDPGDQTEFDDEELQKRIKERQDRYGRMVAEGQSFKCAICGVSSADNDGDMVTVSEVRHDYELSYCFNCAAGITVSVLLSLPLHWQNQVIERFVASGGRTQEQVVEGVLSDLGDFVTMVSPTLLDPFKESTQA